MFTQLALNGFTIQTMNKSGFYVCRLVPRQHFVMHFASLVPRPSNRPVFDHLQYAGESLVHLMFCLPR